jgi:hypothetical protein
MKKVVVIFEEDDREILNMRVEDLVKGSCDICHNNEISYILRLDDGNIYGICEECFKKVEL